MGLGRQGDQRGTMYLAWEDLPRPHSSKKKSGSGKALHDSGGVPSERIQNALAHKGYFCMVIALLLLDIF